MVLASLIFLENNSGIIKATMTANMSSPELCLASNTLKFCRLNFNPPTKKDNPITSRRFPITEPVKEASTTPIRPAFNEKMEIINSTAFPNVAFNNPPIRGPATIVKLSVALPIKPERPIIVMHDRPNINMLGNFNNEPIKIKGKPMITTIRKILFTNAFHSSQVHKKRAG